MVSKERLCAQTCPPFCTAASNDFAASNGCHTGAKPMTTFANKVAGLKSAFHESISYTSIRYGIYDRKGDRVNRFVNFCHPRP